ncbi:MAG: alpha/beta hydrolase [Gammaproteobacteria bacterium]|nr:alpha/beta hydrolase [Gammaproteobacteria bacterium]
MPTFKAGKLSIHYDIEGEGFPVLLLAPGGMRSAAALWERAPFDPRKVLADSFQVISMDQRNAGASRGPVSGADGWHTYAHDQLALLDHLGVQRCHVLGMCIGGPFCLGLMAAAPERIAAGVLLQPIGLDGNRDEFFDLFDGWAAGLRESHPQVADADWAAFRERMFGGEFVFHPDRDTVASLEQPMLVLRGDDAYHPASVSEALADVAPRAELLHSWKEGPDCDAAVQRIRGFLTEFLP